MVNLTDFSFENQKIGCYNELGCGKKMATILPSEVEENKSRLLNKQQHFYRLDHGTEDRLDFIGARKVTSLFMSLTHPAGS